MSKLETPMTRWYWRTVNKRKGLLIEEFPAVEGGKGRSEGKRHIDGVIVLGEKAGRRGPRKGDRELVKGKRVIVIQSKARRLGMGLIGQVVVSRELLKNLKAKVVKSVGVCREDDQILRGVLGRFKKCEAVVYRRGGSDHADVSLREPTRGASHRCFRPQDDDAYKLTMGSRDRAKN